MSRSAASSLSGDNDYNDYDDDNDDYNDDDDDGNNDDNDDYDYEEDLEMRQRLPIPVHHHHEEEDEEATGLMSSETVSRDGFEDESLLLDDDERACSGSFRALVVSMICVLLISSLALLIPSIGSFSNRLESLRTPARIPVVYDCPANTDTIQAAPANYDPSFSVDYVQVTEQLTDNMTEFLATFREDNFDNWGHSYETVKQGMYSFKSTYFPPFLKDGDSIYESACGIGLNLFMTLEILEEAKGIENLFVYGNEYLKVSADKANAVLDHMAPGHGRKGMICPGDSTNLDFVPSNAFDLVYTGYIR
jgi:hypothetical protein